MNKSAVVCMVFLVAICAAACQADQGKLVAPVPIHLPYGSKVVTEINFSSSDVLGLVRQVIPALSDLMATFATISKDFPGPQGINLSPEAVAKLDLKPLAEAMEGISNVRLLIAKYPKGAAADLVPLFDAGAEKSGALSKVLSDTAMIPGTVTALYSLPDGAGYMGYAYDPGKSVILAGRLTGKLDVARIMKWASDVVKVFAAELQKGSEGTEPVEATSQSDETTGSAEDTPVEENTPQE